MIKIEEGGIRIWGERDLVARGSFRQGLETGVGRGRVRRERYVPGLSIGIQIREIDVTSRAATAAARFARRASVSIPQRFAEGRNTRDASPDAIRLDTSFLFRLDAFRSANACPSRFRGDDLSGIARKFYCAAVYMGKRM